MSVSTAPTTPSTATSLVTPSSVFSSCQLDDSESPATNTTSGSTTQNLHKHLLSNSRKSSSNVLPILSDEKGDSSECVLDEMLDDEDDDFDDEEEDLEDEEMLNEEEDFLEDNGARNGVDSEINNRSDDGEATDSMAAHSNGGCVLSSDLEAHNEENGNDDMFINSRNGRISSIEANDLDEEGVSMESNNGQEHDHHSLNHHHHHHRDRLLGASSFSDDLLNNMDSQNPSELNQDFKIDPDSELLYPNESDHDLNTAVTEASSLTATTTAAMVCNKVRKRSANQAYEYLTSLPDSHAFQEWITQNETDFTWVHKRNSMTNIGKKFYYICNYRIKKGFQKCPAVIYALFPSTTSSAVVTNNPGQNMVMVYSCGEHDHRRLPNFAETLCDSGIVGDQHNDEDGYSSSPKNLSPSSVMSGQQKTGKQSKQNKKESNGMKRLSSSSSTNILTIDTGSTSSKYRRMGNGERNSTPESVCDNNNNSNHVTSFYGENILNHSDVDKNNNNICLPDDEHLSTKKDEDEIRQNFLNKSQLAFMTANKVSIDQSANLSANQNKSPSQASARSSSFSGMLNPTMDSLARLLEMQKANGSMDENKLMLQLLNTAAFKQPNLAASNTAPQPQPTQLLLQMIAQAKAQSKFQSNSLLNPPTVMSNSSNKPIKQSNAMSNQATHANLTKKQLQAKLAQSEQMLMQQQRQLSQINGTINPLDGGNECAVGINNRPPANNSSVSSANQQLKKILPHIPGSPQLIPMTNGNGLPTGFGLLNDLKQVNGQILQGNGLIMGTSPATHLNGLHHNSVDFMQQMPNQQQLQSHNQKLSALNHPIKSVNKKHHQHKELATTAGAPTPGNFSPSVPFKLIQDLNGQPNGANIANILLQQQHQSNMLSPHHHSDMNAVNNAAAAAAAAHLTNMELAKLLNSTNLLVNKPSDSMNKNGIPSPLLSSGISSPAINQFQQVNLLEQLISASKASQQQQSQQIPVNRLPRAAPLSLETVPIHLDVGGHVYTSTLETLTKHPNSRLSKMFNGTLPIVFDTQRQQYFIDRDGKLFRHVLNFMRQGALNLPDNFNDMSSLIAEAKYFELDTLYAQLESLNQSKNGHEIRSTNGMTANGSAISADSFNDDKINNNNQP